MQTVTDLWNGNIVPCEHCGSHDPVINELMCLIERNRENLSRGLTEAQIEIFQKYMDCSEEYLLRMMELAFCMAFAQAAGWLEMRGTVRIHGSGKNECNWMNILFVIIFNPQRDFRDGEIRPTYYSAAICSVPHLQGRDGGNIMHMDCGFFFV